MSSLQVTATNALPHKHAALLRRALVLVAWLAVAYCAMAQNNPYKINDSLYPLYREAHLNRTSKQGLDLANQLYAKAAAIKDYKAQCLALTVPMLYYLDRQDNEKEFLQAVKALQDKARQTGYKQYYYYGITQTTSFYLKQQKYDKAINYIKSIEDKARNDNDYTGIYFGLMGIGNVHMTRYEFTLALRAFKEALDICKKHVKDQDIASIYGKISDCCFFAMDYQRMHDYAADGYHCVKSGQTRLRLLHNMAYAMLKLGRDDEAMDYYKTYASIYGKRPNMANADINNIEMVAIGLIAGNKLDEARKWLDNIPKRYASEQVRLEIEYWKRRKDYKILGRFRNTFYRNRIALCDNIRTQDAVEIASGMYNKKLEIDRQNLLIERQRMDNERRRAEIDNANLELANTNLSLRNSDLELRREKADAGVLRLSYDNKRLEAQKLHDNVLLEHKRNVTFQTHMAMYAAIAVIIIIATLLIAQTHHKVTTNLRKVHQMLAHNHSELKKAHNHAVAADNVKTAILNNMSDDIKIPLMAIVSQAALISEQSDKISAEQRAEMFQRLHSNSDKLLKIVADVLDKAQKYSSEKD